MRPECLTANQARGRRTPSRRHERLAKRPFRRTMWADYTGVSNGGDKFRSFCPGRGFAPDIQ